MQENLLFRQQERLKKTHHLIYPVLSDLNQYQTGSLRSPFQMGIEIFLSFKPSMKTELRLSLKLSKPVDKQEYKCSASFGSPPPFVIPDDSLTFKHDKRAPLIIKESKLVPYTKSSKFMSNSSYLDNSKQYVKRYDSQ